MCSRVLEQRCSVVVVAVVFVVVVVVWFFKAKYNSAKVARQWPPFELYSFICNDLH